ncbi:hypothetical protein [Leuconostoc mesenteroides]|nr:hypothetical protein [Leuconostoc mesenteroides]
MELEQFKKINQATLTKVNGGDLLRGMCRIMNNAHFFELSSNL